MRSIATSVILMALVTSAAWAHDPSCVVVYNNTGVTEGMPLGVFDGDVLLDDVHTSVGQATLCAVDVRGKVVGPGVLSLYVYQGSPANDPPTTLLAGPVDMSPPFTNVNETYHFELPATLVGQDLWIGFGWTGDGGGFAGSNRGPASVGSSQDVWWGSYPPQAAAFDDAGPGNTANIYLVVYATIPTPTHEGTWGELKATYR